MAINTDIIDLRLYYFHKEFSLKKFLMKRVKLRKIYIYINFSYLLSSFYFLY